MSTFEITTTIEVDEDMVNENNHAVSREAWAHSYLNDVIDSNISLFQLKIVNISESSDGLYTPQAKEALIKSYNADIKTLIMMRENLIVKERK